MDTSLHTSHDSPSTLLLLQASASLLEVDLIIIPINISNAHWAIIVLDLKKKCIVRYDSLSVSRACEHPSLTRIRYRNRLSTRYLPLA